MKTNRLFLPMLALVVGLFTTAASLAHDGQDHSAKVPSAPGQLVEPDEKDAAWLAQAQKAYPLKLCVVSDEGLGGHGDTVDRIYREKGKPDRLVRFCCDSCIDDFAQEPAKFLRKLDESPKPRSGHPPHHH